VPGAWKHSLLAHESRLYFIFIYFGGFAHAHGCINIFIPTKRGAGRIILAFLAQSWEFIWNVLGWSPVFPLDGWMDGTQRSWNVYCTLRQGIPHPQSPTDELIKFHFSPFYTLPGSFLTLEA